MKDVGTLKEIGAKPGDVVEFHEDIGPYVITLIDGDGDYFARDNRGYSCGPLGNALPWRMISRASDTPKLWRDMTPEEKGALLLAHHEGKVIESRMVDVWKEVVPSWEDCWDYRVRPGPKVETVKMYVKQDKNGQWIVTCSYHTSNRHRITFNTIDGKPDTASIKMEAL